ncbi:MAG: thiamine pyrophosphate-binding protein [Caldilineaceae bacterium]|nr:thiamine pyrophosphate-binding protein [Caldilineaceae bacterium]
MNGGDLVAEVLHAQGVPFLFTLIGGHISPILVGCKARGIRVIDVRHEVNAVFAADAVARLTGRPGVAAVTAGPGVTNTLTAVKNAQMAQSPVVLLGGAAATVLQGRGALQDIDQLSLLRPVVKWAKSVRRVKEIVPALEEAFQRSLEGVPGPVFVELPVDLLYNEKVVREWYGLKSDRGGSFMGRVTQLYLRRHLRRLFAGAQNASAGPRREPVTAAPDAEQVARVLDALGKAERPLMLAGSQATLNAPAIHEIAWAVETIGVPVYLSGMARGLLGPNHPLQMRHKRRNALREADLVLLAGVPVDFRLDYGNHIRGSATYISVNRSKEDLTKNRKPDIGILGDPGDFLRALAVQAGHLPPRSDWHAQLQARDDTREAEIAEQAREPSARINPLHLLRTLDGLLGDKAILVADGGDFVGTASYILRPRGPLTWLDPGAFGTLGVGAGFALGAKLVHPDADVWIIYGDGSAGYSLAEFDTFTRHNIAIAALVGNDAGWTQIARDQVEMLGDDVGTALAYTDYDSVAAGFGGAGLRLDDPELAEETLHQAQAIMHDGRAVLVNAILGKSDFRKGSLSM